MAITYLSGQRIQGSSGADGGTQSYNASTTNVTLSGGSNLTATADSSAWGNRAYSTKSYNPNQLGSGETFRFIFTTADATKNGFMGFDSTPTTISGHGNDGNSDGVDYGFYLVGNDTSANYLSVSEKGDEKYQTSSSFFTTSTYFMIEVNNSGVVKYYADTNAIPTTLLYTSLTAMSGDFYVLFYPYDSGFNTTITSWSNGRVDDKESVTDVPDGSEFEQTDDYKSYQFSDGGYDSGLGSAGNWTSVANLTTNDSVTTPSGLNSAGLTKSWFSNGSSTDISTTTGQIIPVDSDITFVTWINSTDVTANTQCIFNSEADNYFVVYIANGGDRLEYKVQDGDGESSGGEADYPFAINRWYMIACTFDASTGQTISYVFNDAGTKTEVKDSDVDPIRTVATNTSWRMMEGSTETFDGRVLSPCVWNVILSSSDLDDLSASGNGVAMNTIQKDKIVCYWDSQTGTNGTPISNLAVGKKWTERGTAI